MALPSAAIGDDDQMTIRFSTLLSRFGRATALLRAAIAQISDEAAYKRFLAHASTVPSAASWAAFLRDRYASAAGPRRCC
jgi:hypothetical protein